MFNCFYKYNKTFFPALKAAGLIVDVTDKTNLLSIFKKAPFTAFFSLINQLNNTALGIYSKYLGRKDYDLKYTFQKYINYNWVDINFNTNPTFDPEFLIENKNYSLYRVKITSISDPNWLSFSNTVCIPYQPIIFIPNAFSPNSDNINELFGPTTFGIEWYKIKILNQWGEIIFKGDKNQKWDGENTTNGVYTCIIEYKTNDGLLNTQRLNIHL